MTFWSLKRYQALVTRETHKKIYTGLPVSDLAYRELGNNHSDSHKK